MVLAHVRIHVYISHIYVYMLYFVMSASTLPTDGWLWTPSSRTYHIISDHTYFLPHDKIYYKTFTHVSKQTILIRELTTCVLHFFCQELFATLITKNWTVGNSENIIFFPQNIYVHAWHKFGLCNVDRPRKYKDQVWIHIHWSFILP